MTAKRRYRAIFLSDVHLGTRGCKAEFLLDFLERNEADTLYLIGDIIDGWRLKRAPYWPIAHNAVVQAVLAKAQGGTRVVLVPGNHDEFLRGYLGHTFGGVEIQPDAYHRTADGRRLWLVHGDIFDGVITNAKWLAYLGDWAYTAALWLNHHFNEARRRFGYPYWSLSQYLKLKVKNAVKFIDQFETVVAEEARRRGADGVVCGHIHHAQIRDIGGTAYCNTGDWVESCTAMVEHGDGRLEILAWAELRALDRFLPRRTAQAVRPAA